MTPIQQPRRVWLVNPVLRFMPEGGLEPARSVKRRKLQILQNAENDRNAQNRRKAHVLHTRARTLCRIPGGDQIFSDTTMLDPSVDAEVLRNSMRGPASELQPSAQPLVEGLPIDSGDSADDLEN